MTNSTDPKKILLVGLDNSGKTSIVMSLKGIKTLPKFFNVKPSKGEDIQPIKVLDSEFSIWDLGGQESYRIEYLKNFNKYIKGCSKLIYVFDIQDTKRYDLALEYFENLINLVENNFNTNTIEISIFLHKNDPDLNVIKPELTREIIDDLKEKIKNRIEKTSFFYQIFKTTIYALFEKNITV